MRRHIPLFVFMLALAAPAQAARWYDIELIVFGHTNASPVTSEPVAETAASSAALQGLELSGAPAQPRVGPRDPEFDAFRRLTLPEYQLGGAMATLRKSGAYRPVVHVAWRQPVAGRKQALPVRIHSGARGPQGSFSTEPETLDGTVRISVGRYLHIETDLFYHPSYGGATYRLKDSRRMRSRELHYIDHPAFGVLVVIRPDPGGAAESEAESVPAP